MYKRVVIAFLLTVVLISAVRFRAAQSAAASTPGASFAFSTFLGGAQVKSTYGTAIALDKKGGLIVTGRTQAADFPILNPAQKLMGVERTTRSSRNTQRTARRSCFPRTAAVKTWTWVRMSLPMPRETSTLRGRRIPKTFRRRKRRSSLRMVAEIATASLRN